LLALIVEDVDALAAFDDTRTDFLMLDGVRIRVEVVMDVA
jgi:hypothetical protein